MMLGAHLELEGQIDLQQRTRFHGFNHLIIGSNQIQQVYMHFRNLIIYMSWFMLLGP